MLGRIIFGSDKGLESHEAKGVEPSSMVRLQRHVSYFGNQEGLDGLLKHVQDSGDEQGSATNLLHMLWDKRAQKPHQPFASWPDVEDAEFRDVILKMMSLDPKRRITARQALEHPWFRES